MVAITIEPGEVFHNKFGKYVHDDFIGVKFGSKVSSPLLQREFDLIGRFILLHLIRAMSTFFAPRQSCGRCLCLIAHKSCICQISPISHSG